MTEAERQKMLAAFSIGPKMVALIEQAGIHHLDELENCHALDIAFKIEAETGTRLNKLGVDALANLIELANEQGGQT